MIKRTLYIIIALFGLVLAFFIYKSYFSKDADIAVIQAEAAKYFETNRNYGFETNPGDITNCFSKNLFTRSLEVGEIFAKEGVDEVSCKFKIDNHIVTAWSVSLIKGDRVYCGDSLGNNKETPGISTTSNCNAE